MADDALHAAPPDLALSPAARLLWRGPDAVQLELGGNSVVVEGLPLPAVRAIVAREPDPGAAPVPAVARPALAALHRAGYLWPRTTDDDDARLAPPAPRLAGELRALQARHGEAAAELLAARRWASVAIEGTGRVAAHLAAVLAGAGVGRVYPTTTGAVRLAQAAPGGLLPGDEGAPRARAVEAAVRRAAPEVDTTPLAADHRPELTVLALDGPLPEERRDALHAADAAHLCVAVGLDRGVVGPLVVPGLTSCLRCADLIRRDHDPAWSALAAQLATPPRYGPASGVALATVVTGVAALQALTFLDGGEPAVLDATLEFAEPDWRLRRRSWAVHPECGCTAGGPATDPLAAPP